ncbi:gamma-glutamylcyclotransferase [Candidatus Daviesbacteria bacterium]|nr:gamma-glutamylcyclotransferase [Candidatus Daviesbacteria bacterium]
MAEYEKFINYFGYGANRDRRMMEWITGDTSLVGQSAVLKGFKLVVQGLDQVPDSIFPTAPAPFSPRQLLQESWTTDFESYTISPDPEGEVVGTLWRLSRLNRDLVREWELVDFGWYQDLRGVVITEDGKEAEIETEGLRANQEYDRQVDGHHYETWLNSPEEFARVAEKSRKEFFDRLAKNEEDS